MAKYGVRPSRALSVFGVVIGIGMLLVFLNVFSDSNGDFSGAGGGFIALWVIGLIFVIGYHLFNATTGKGHAEVVENLSQPADAHQIAVEEKLEDLMRLRARDEISVEEFDARRVDIMKSQLSPNTDRRDPDRKKSVEERLKTLVSLKEKGLISDEEFESKREEIIRSL